MVNQLVALNTDVDLLCLNSLIQDLSHLFDHLLKSLLDKIMRVQTFRLQI